MATYTDFESHRINVCHGSFEDGKNKGMCSPTYNPIDGFQTWPKCSEKVAQATGFQVAGRGVVRGVQFKDGERIDPLEEGELNRAVV